MSENEKGSENDLVSIKELITIFNLNEAQVRSIIAVFEVPVRGKGPKPPRGTTPNTYRRSDFAMAVLAVQNTKKLMESVP